MISPERLDSMQRDWAQLLGGYRVAPADAYPPFDRLVAAYTEPNRHYHTLEHLAEMFRVVGRLANLCRDLRAVRLAVWFHDAVYDPRAKDNEERSAALVTDWLGPLGLPGDVLTRAAGLVRATAHLSGDSSAADPDADVLLDADLAILGASEDRYRRYAEDIRREYAFVPEETYRAGRAAVLKHFLTLPRIYRTVPMAEAGEAAARRNLAAELGRLAG
jgi:predicted metal-dependent HD superfamily phosphohydrolase